jgi:hypothetical protein
LIAFDHRNTIFGNLGRCFEKNLKVIEFLDEPEKNIEITWPYPSRVILPNGPKLNSTSRSLDLKIGLPSSILAGHNYIDSGGITYCGKRN